MWILELGGVFRMTIGFRLGKGGTGTYLDRGCLPFRKGYLGSACSLPGGQTCCGKCSIEYWNISTNIERGVLIIFIVFFSEKSELLKLFCLFKLGRKFALIDFLFFHFFTF